MVEQKEQEPAMNEQVTWSWAGMVRGMRSIIPLALGGLPDGIVWGVLAHHAGLSLGEVLLMSGLVCAGSAQFLAIKQWSVPLAAGAILPIIGTTLIVNLRYLLLGAALRPWFAHLRPTRTYLSLFFMSDENWALTMREFMEERRDAAFLLGSGLLLFVSWVSATVIGKIVGMAISDPMQWGLDFVFTAVFLTLLIGMWKGKSDLLPWVVAAIVAIGADRLLPGSWYILLGSLAGSLVGAITSGGEKNVE
ncbi:MAG TPA: AzlC family ABC transporter permease [Ktedonobacteraceae bacterium]|nr:AzlC family ABC transporter permease [Ktedonobacteraceae bacterium]